MKEEKEDFGVVLVRDFEFLKKFGYQISRNIVFDMPLVGQVINVDWSKTDGQRVIHLRLSLGGGRRPPVLSIVVKSNDGSFTFSDWLHANGKEDIAGVADLSNYTDIKEGLHALARFFAGECDGQLSEIINATLWLHVPTYRGTND